MAQQTIVGVYDNASTAQQAAQEVIAAGIDRSRVRLSAQANTTVTTSGSDAEDKGFWASMKDAFGFGEDDDQYGYREASRRGSTVLSVDAEDDQADTVCTILERHNPIDLDQKAEQWKSEGWSGYDQYKTAFASGTGAGAAQATTSQGATARTESTATGQAVASQPATTQPAAATAATAGQAIPVVEEKLNVGKQVVTRGGIRIHSRVTERPVEAQVNLREEKVVVQRHAVDRPLTGAEATAAFQEQTITATEKAEQAVVSKQARVVEEIEVGKTATERTETVRDTVRRSDVEVERIDASTDARFRPAYEFADELAVNEQYRGRTFDTFESDARRSFEQRNPNSKWDEEKDAIRLRFDRARSKT